MIDKAGKWSKTWTPKLQFLATISVLLVFIMFIGYIFVEYNTNGMWDGSGVVPITSDVPKCQVLKAVPKCEECENRQVAPPPKCGPSKALPQGIVRGTSDLELRSLWDREIMDKPYTSKYLLAIPAGVQQIDDVDKMVQKFLPASNFTIMLFHYDGLLDEWRRLPWSARAIHVVAFNQTKWWFAKRFMHPDIVSAYDFIFLWDEDMGVDYFQADRYLDIVKEEGLEISQPALDPHLSSEIHHRITIRDPKTRVHRRRRDHCLENSKKPPCTGWVEMMAPVFSRAAWRCVWHLIQNDLVHAWGLDMKLGYCAQGDPTKNVGVVDSEYLIHRGIPSLGGGIVPSNETERHWPYNVTPNGVDARGAVRKRSHIEMNVFNERWNAAVEEDECWIDPQEAPA